MAEILVGLLISSVILVGAVQFSKSVFYQSKTGFSSSTIENELSRFQTLMITDLERAGSDPTGGLALNGYGLDIANSGSCGPKNFVYGLIFSPMDPNCKDPIGQLGILSYMGVDVDRNGMFYPEEGLNLEKPLLRPPPPHDVEPHAPDPLPVNFYNDYIVYSLEYGKIHRKNLGDPTISEGDTSEIVLQNVVWFTLSFKEPKKIEQTYEEGTFYNGVTVSVTVHAPNPDPNYTHPTLPPTSPYYHHHTVTREFTYDVIPNVIAIH